MAFDLLNSLLSNLWVFFLVVLPFELHGQGIVVSEILGRPTDHSVTIKGAETRMGGGKGAPDHWVAVIKPGRVLFEISGVKEETAREAMRLASHKLPIKTQFITRAEAK